MFHRIFSFSAAAAATAALVLAQPTTTRPAELQLYSAISREPDPARKLPLLDQWAALYPQSDYQKERNLYYISCYATMEGNALQPGAQSDTISAGAEAARAMLAKAMALFALEMKPPAVKPEDWKTAWEEAVHQAHSTLAAIAFNQKDYPKAETELLALLEDKPDDAATAFQLGSVIVSERDTSRYPAAIYYLARAVTAAGPGALNPGGRQATEDYLERIYSNYHGSLAGLVEVKSAASQAPALPADWKIQSIKEISEARIATEEQFAKDHPDIALWRNLKDNLSASDGDTYFKESVKDRELPSFKATVISQPDARTIIVSIDTTGAAEATLRLDSPLKVSLNAGTEIEFTGVPESFAREPFMVVFSQAKQNRLP